MRVCEFLTLVNGVVVVLFKNLPEDEGHTGAGAVRTGEDLLQHLCGQVYVPSEQGGGGEHWSVRK